MGWRAAFAWFGMSHLAVVHQLFTVVPVWLLCQDKVCYVLCPLTFLVTWRGPLCCIDSVTFPW